MRNLKIINLTPHEITIMGDKTNLKIPPSGKVIRCMVNRTHAGEINGITITKTAFDKVDKLPKPQKGVIYIVSSLVAQACKDRKDLYIPDDTIRDENGRVIGCRSLAQIVK